jgi:NTE family protein
VSPRRPSRVGLVLGAGGVLGGAWIVGALHAIASETGWDPGSADRVAGTSAGAMVGALLCSGVPPWYMVATSAGEQLEELTDITGAEPSDEPSDEPGDEHRSAGAVYRLAQGFPALGPGSWRLAVASLARPYRYSPGALIAGWLPKGPVSTEPLKDTVRRVCDDGWAPHPGFRAVAVDFATGRRVAFGHPDAPPASLPDAVAASCAIPGFYRAVEIGGREYVDGGIHSMSNADVLRHDDLDLVLVLNPMSSLHQSSSSTLGERLAGVLRQASGSRLGAEAERLRATGAEVLLVQPTVHDLDVMGTNLMSRSRRHEVIETAARSVTRHLRESPLGDRLAALPAGEPGLVRRPPGPPAAWPDLRSLAAARRAPRTAPLAA